MVYATRIATVPFNELLHKDNIANFKENVNLKRVENNGMALQTIPDEEKTIKVCNAAKRENPASVIFFPERQRSVKLYTEVFETLDKTAIQNIPEDYFIKSLKNYLQSSMTKKYNSQPKMAFSAINKRITNTQREKCGGTFYINNRPLSEFLQEQNFSPYWNRQLELLKGTSIDELTAQILRADVKGNANLINEQNKLSTVLGLGLVEYKREQTFLYSVNIPDNDNTNYLFYDKSIGLEHANKINEQLEKLGVEWRVSRNDSGKNVYFNVLSQKVFENNQKQSSEFLKSIGYVGMEMSGNNYIVFNDKDMDITNRVQYMKDKNGEVYGFVYEGEIYADEELVNSNVLAHEYTHIWDTYVQNNNPELWQKGKNILKGTSLWQSVVEDKNYENLTTDDEILSECHSRLVGEMAEKILENIAKRDGGFTRDQVIDWDKEVEEYIVNELRIKPELGTENYISDSVKAEYLKEFLSQPMKDLMSEINISQSNIQSEQILKQIKSELSNEDLEYIHSSDFIEKFGDWEKVNRLEKLKNSTDLNFSSEIFIGDKDITDIVDKLRSHYSKENLKQLQDITRDIGQEKIAQLRKNKNLDEYAPLLIKNKDTGKVFTIKTDVINEIDRHNFFTKGHIEAVQQIDQLIEDSIFIGFEKNEDNRDPSLKEFYYFSRGVKIDNENYTAKCVFVLNDKNELYYDQNLSEIEKGKVIETILNKNMLETSSPLQKGADSFEQIRQEFPDKYYDKRLNRICQVPQMPYLEFNNSTKQWQPTKETIEAVRSGTLFVEKVGQIFEMQKKEEPTQAENTMAQNLKHSGTEKSIPENLQPISKENLQDLGFSENTANYIIDYEVSNPDSQMYYDKNSFDFAFSTDDIQKQQSEPSVVPKNIGEIKSIVGNLFSGRNIKLAQDFQKELIEKGIVKADEEFILVNELEANAAGTKIKDNNEPYVVLTIPVKENGVKNFVETKYYHISSLENSQKIILPKENEETKSDIGEDGIIIPEVAFITQNGLKLYKDMRISGYDKESGSYTLSHFAKEKIIVKDENGNLTEKETVIADEKIIVPEKTINELVSDQRKNVVSQFNGETLKRDKMLLTQYEDYFKPREPNTANNFRHNLEVWCRKKANNPCDALKIAKILIQEMSETEKEKTRLYLDKMSSGTRNYNPAIIDIYHDAKKAVPLNEEFIKYKMHDKIIARPMYDEISGKGEKIDRAFNIKIGDSVKMNFKTDSLYYTEFSKKEKFITSKENLLENCKIISASKEGNCVTLMNEKQAVYTVPRDEFLKNYAKQQKQIKNGEKQERKKAVSISW